MWSVSAAWDENIVIALGLMHFTDRELVLSADFADKGEKICVNP